MKSNVPIDQRVATQDETQPDLTIMCSRGRNTKSIEGSTRKARRWTHGARHNYAQDTPCRIVMANHAQRR